MVGEDGKAVLAGFLFQIRQHFRIDASFKQYFSVLCFYYLATIIGENKPSIIAEFEGFGQWHQSISRPTGCQNYAHSHLLDL